MDANKLFAYKNGKQSGISQLNNICVYSRLNEIQFQTEIFKTFDSCIIRCFGLYYTFPGGIIYYE